MKRSTFALLISCILGHTLLAQSDTIVLKSLNHDIYTLIRTEGSVYETSPTSDRRKVVARLIHPADSSFDYEGLFFSLDTLIELPSLYCGGGVTYVPVLLDSTANVLAIGEVKYVGEPALVDSISATLFSTDMSTYVTPPINGYWLLLAQVNISRKPARVYIAP